MKTVPFDGDEADAVVAALGKKIKSVILAGDALVIVTEDGYGLKIEDDGQSCCESRYMTCDDVLDSYVGAYLTGVDVKDGPDVEGDYGEVHEVQFLVVDTTKGSITVATHNEHNGYYGGFSMKASSFEPA